MKKYCGAMTFLQALLLFGCLAEEEAPIITSATYQHTQYNGRPQPVQAETAKEDAPPPVITYFRSEADLEQGLNGESAAPADVGDYYARLERPAGNGYKQGKPIKIEYHIQKAFISISADAVQRFKHDGRPKHAEARTEPPEEPPLEFSYFTDSGEALAAPPAAKGGYRVNIVFPGNDRYMGASREIELYIEPVPN
ncbi:MAG: hypothetical protein LBD86_06735 [Spirochaetaceae bacterium]|nr:hypothetical protein [Spirochaetaceae bacterium]